MHKISIPSDPILDTLRMKQVLGGVADPRGKIKRMLNSGYLVLLRRGLYATRKDLNPIALAGPMYGPSYISFETALSWHGMIPEAVTEILSATLRRPAQFTNRYGTYRYQSVPAPVYSYGMTNVKNDSLPFLIASPTKALADRIAREPGFRALTDVRHWIEDMRIEIETPLDHNDLRACAAAYGRPAVRWLLRYAEKHDLVTNHPQIE
jgi:hypothetical protein